MERSAPSLPGADLVQQLFERHLGPPRIPPLGGSLPGPVAAAGSSSGAALRDKERVSFRVARGLALDYQAVPATGTLLGLTYQPERPAPHRKPQPVQAAAATAATAVSSAAAAAAEVEAAEGAAAGAAGSSAGAVAVAPGAASVRSGGATLAPAAPSSAVLDPQPAHATLWALLQPTPGVGVNTALSAVEGSLTGFGGWHQDGFIDLSRRLGIDYSVSQHPSSGVSGEVEVQATLPKLLLLPEVTLQHRLAGSKRAAGLQRTSAVSLPVLRGSAVVKAQVQEPAAGAGGAAVTLEVQGRGKRSTRGLAGGAKLQAEHSSAFYGSRGSSQVGTSSGSDSDDEHGSYGGTASGDQDSGAQQAAAQRRRVPGLRVHLVPATARSWEDASGHWRQAWGSRLSSTVGYQGRQRRWNLELTSKLTAWLTAAGTMVCDGPADAAAAVALAAPGDAPNGGGADGGGGGGMGARAREAQRCVAAYAGASRLCRAGLKLSCRLQRPTRQQLHLESRLSEGGELSHALRYRLGGSRTSDFQQQRARADVSLVARPSQQKVELKFDLFAPL